MGRDYQIRCKRCGYPYYTENIDRRICVFCRRKTDVRSRKKKLNIMVNSIKDFADSRKVCPNKDRVIKWISAKFEVNKNTVKSYIKELMDEKKVEIFNDGHYDRVKVIKK